MNQHLETTSEEILLDRLVDGELSEAEYRRLLQALDQRPDGWRDCALAFLESQALRCDLRELRQDGETIGLTTGRGQRRWLWTWGGMMTLASAASFLLTFLLTSYSYRNSDQFIAQPANPAGTANGVQFDQFVSAESGPEGIRAQSGRGSIDPLDGRWGNYQLVVNDEDGQPQKIEMPIFASDDPRAQWMLNDQATMPVELMRALRGRGFQVDRQRQWMPVGRTGDAPVLVPMEELRITPVSSRSYQ
jgi:hypothetical protein